MGNPLSALLSEIFLNNLEQKFICNKTNPNYNNIIFYCRYADDTFVIYNGTERQINNFNNYLNNLRTDIKFTQELETQDRLNFLDFTIYKADTNLEYGIFRKPTTTNIVINASSFHPMQYKLASFNSFIHRLLTTPLNENRYNEELNIIK